MSSVVEFVCYFAILYALVYSLAREYLVHDSIWLVAALHVVSNIQQSNETTPGENS